MCSRNLLAVLFPWQPLVPRRSGEVASPRGQCRSTADVFLHAALGPRLRGVRRLRPRVSPFVRRGRGPLPGTLPAAVPLSRRPPPQSVSFGDERRSLSSAGASSSSSPAPPLPGWSSFRRRPARPARYSSDSQSVLHSLRRGSRHVEFQPSTSVSSTKKREQTDKATGAEGSRAPSASASPAVRDIREPLLRLVQANHHPTLAQVGAESKVGGGAAGREKRREKAQGKRWVHPLFFRTGGCRVPPPAFTSWRPEAYEIGLLCSLLMWLCDDLGAHTHFLFKHQLIGGR